MWNEPTEKSIKLNWTELNCIKHQNPGENYEKIIINHKVILKKLSGCFHRKFKVF